jgi:hypothetical protein
VQGAVLYAHSTDAGEAMPRKPPGDGPSAAERQRKRCARLRASLAADGQGLPRAAATDAPDGEKGIGTIDLPGAARQLRDDALLGLDADAIAAQIVTSCAPQ